MLFENRTEEGDGEDKGSNTEVAKEPSLTNGISADDENAALIKLVSKADKLIEVSHSEYWLEVATSKASKIKCADESSVKVMGKLRESITKAEMNGANEKLINSGSKVSKQDPQKRHSKNKRASTKCFFAALLTP